MSDSTKTTHTGVTVKIAFVGTNRTHTLAIADPGAYQFLVELEQNYERMVLRLLDDVREASLAGGAHDVLPLTYRLKVASDQLDAIQAAMTMKEEAGEDSE